MKEYSIVVPAYNESDKITATLTQITSFMNTFSQSYEVIVVDDGSVDSTVQKVSEYVADNPNVLLVKNPHKGKGVAITTGVAKADGQYIYLCDADLSAPISELKKLSVWLKDNDFDIVIASREGHGAQRINEPIYRHIMGRVFNFFVRTLVLPGIQDSQCGFKLFKGEQAKSIFSKLIIYNTQSKVIETPYMGAFDVEVLYIAKKMKLKVKEVPVTWKYVKTTRLSPLKDSIKMLLDIIKIKVNGLKGAYL